MRAATKHRVSIYGLQLAYREGKREMRTTAGKVFGHLLLSLVKNALNFANETFGSHGARVQGLEVYTLIVQAL